MVAAHFHDRIQVGDLIEARAPQGRFTVQADEYRRLVLLAAGVGITPMLSMLREVIYHGERLRRTPPTWFIQSTRTLSELGFRDELYELAVRAKDKIRALRVLSQPEPHARVGEHYEMAGRIDVELLRRCCPWTIMIFICVDRVRLPKRFTTAYASYVLAMTVFTRRLSVLRRWFFNGIS